jgi:cystathionine beta-lyase/cystathionine gamma-synthase
MNETDPTGNPILPDKHGSSDSTPRSSSKRRLPTPHAAPLVLASVWQMESPEQAADILAGQSPGYAYRRDGHPNADQLVEQLKGLHQADWAILTAQGMSSLAALALATLEPGDLVLLAQPLYGRTSTLFEGELARFGIRTLSVPAVDLACWKEAMGSRPKMAIAETVGNPRMTIPPIPAMAELCRDAGCSLVIDNTLASGSLCQPLKHGAHWIVESLGKIVCGHSDAMVGMIAGNGPIPSRLRAVVSTFGMASSPMDCWLTIRGLQTLPLRLERASRNAMALASHFHNHPAIARIDYPGLPNHPQHAIAKQLFCNHLSGFMLAMELVGDQSTVAQFFRSLSPEVPFCPSLGEIETTVSHPWTTSHRTVPLETKASLGIREGLVRVSCGVEPTETLIARFAAALDQVAKSSGSQ